MKKYIFSMFIAAFLLCPAITFAQNKAKPNVLIIVTDDQGYGEISAHGNPIFQTPNLDVLRKGSVRFNDFHASPMCTPSRGQLMTGKDAVRNKALNVSSGRTLLKKDIKTMADWFSGAGYETGIFGKWHLGDNYPYRPEDRGFSHTLWFPSSHVSSIPDFWNNNYFDDTYIEDGHRKQFKGFCTDVFFNEAKKWIKENSNKGKASFTYLATNAPHEPFYAPEADIIEIEKLMVGKEAILNMSPKRKEGFIRYLAMIRNIDSNIGKMMRFLKDEKLLENTIVLFLTDNGSTFGPDYFNAGMRGRKSELYEGGHRVPLFIHWPDKEMGKPRDINGLAQIQDILPTLLDLCHIPFADTSFDGMSLSQVLKGKEKIPEDRTLFVNYSRMPWQFNYPSPYSSSLVTKEGSGVLWKRWRLINDKELYNLDEDPLQKENVYQSRPDVVKLMTERLDKWWNPVAATVNIPERVIIGSPEENSSLITACEWMDVFVDQQSQVKHAERKNSYWLLDVFENGTYEIELRRWPKEYNKPLSQAGPGEVALPIKSARIFVKQDGAGTTYSKEISAASTSVSFKVKLTKAPLALHSWFMDETGSAMAGAYYAYITKTD